MIIVSSVTYPPESAKQMAQRFLEAPQVPDFLVQRGPYIGSKGADGIFVLSLFELDNANLAAGMEFAGNYMSIFYGVPGFRYEVKPFFNVEEGLKIIGMG